MVLSRHWREAERRECEEKWRYVVVGLRRGSGAGGGCG